MSLMDDLVVKHVTSEDYGLGLCPFCGERLQTIAKTSMPPKYYNVCTSCGYRSEVYTNVTENDAYAKETESGPFPDKSQEAKADAGKARLTLVPRRILYDIARIREYGNAKYHDPDNWKQVEPQRYRDAMMRHMIAYLDDPTGVDEESGLPHLWHLACNVAFLCEMEDKK